MKISFVLITLSTFGSAAFADQITFSQSPGGQTMVAIRGS